MTRLALPVAGMLTALAIVLFFQRDVSDFRMFYDSGTAWRHGDPVYTRAHQNLHPPSVTLVLFAPLSRLSYHAAEVIWVLASAAALIGSLVAMARTLRWTSAQTVHVAALAHLLGWGIWFQGQIVWLLLYPCTQAWQAARVHRWTHAGLWLAPVIAIKPPFALLALALPWQCWTTAGLVSATLSGLSALVTGTQVWLDWWRMSDLIHWLSWPENASLWGAISRAKSGQLFGGTMSEIPVWGVVLIAILAIYGALRCRRQPQVDRRFALGVLLTVLISPLGWTSLLIAGLGPFAASWTRGHWIPYGFVCVPMVAMYPLLRGEPWAVRTLGMVYVIAVLSAWVAWTRTPPPSWSSAELP